MKRYLPILLLSCLAFVSCQLEDNDITPKENYTRGFISKYGLISGDQTWNVAVRKSIGVSLKRPEDVKVYVDYFGTWRQVAHYTGVNGDKELAFDAPRGMDSLLVKVGPVPYRLRAGEALDPSSPKGRAVGTGNDVVSIQIEDDETHWVELSKEDIMDYEHILPEGEYNLGKVTQNYMYVSNGPFIIYPVYWNTSNQNTMGIYYYDEDTHERVNVPVYRIKESDGVLQYRSLEDREDYVTITLAEVNRMLTVYLRTNNLPSLTDSDLPNLNDEEKTIIKQYIREHGDESCFYPHFTSKFYDTQHPGRIQVSKYQFFQDWQNVAGMQEVGAYLPEETLFRSKGIKIDLPRGMKFGVYLQEGGGTTYYSQQQLNQDPYWDHSQSPAVQREGAKAVHTSTFVDKHLVYNGALCFTFEDWDDQYGSSDMDINDLVFMIKGDPNQPDIFEEDDPLSPPLQWILAAEDLGSTDDFDFNDVVVGLTHVAGQDSMHIKALAAGGILPVSLLYNGMTVGPAVFHSWFGDGTVPYNTMINTYYNNLKGRTVSLPCSTDFSFANLGVYDDAAGTLGGFSIKVVTKKGETAYVRFPQKSEAPQMICVPDGWAWPKERVDITEAYPAFLSWMSDPAGHAEWYKEDYDLSKLIFKPGYHESQGGESGGGGGQIPDPTPTLDENELVFTECSLPAQVAGGSHCYEISIPADKLERLNGINLTLSGDNTGTGSPAAKLFTTAACDESHKFGESWQVQSSGWNEYFWGDRKTQVKDAGYKLYMLTFVGVELQKAVIYAN